jgi:L-ascorbate metabolism protein UlaG (beta-lactamase superfamily)
MKKVVLICLLTFFSLNLQADQDSLKVTWFGSTCVAISDGENTILFDPFFTRPSFWKVISFQDLESDPKTVKKWLSKIDAEKISAIITSHSHYDHVLDLVEVQKITKAAVYGSESTKNIALGGGVPSSKIKTLKKNMTLKVGDFEIKVEKGDHPPHFLGMTLASGKITEPLKNKASAYAYKKDDDFSFYIKHPNGNILFHPSGNTRLTAEDTNSFKAELVILGVANRKSSEELLKSLVLPVGAATVIPVHFDNIFTPLSMDPKDLMGVNMPEFYKTVSKVAPVLDVQTLKIGETFGLKN